MAMAARVFDQVLPQVIDAAFTNGDKVPYKKTDAAGGDPDFIIDGSDYIVDGTDNITDGS